VFSREAEQVGAVVVVDVLGEDVVVVDVLGEDVVVGEAPVEDVLLEDVGSVTVVEVADVEVPTTLPSPQPAEVSAIIAIVETAASAAITPCPHLRLRFTSILQPAQA